MAWASRGAEMIYVYMLAVIGVVAVLGFLVSLALLFMEMDER